MNWQEACMQNGWAIRVDNGWEYRVYRSGACNKMHTRTGCLITKVPEDEWCGYTDWKPEVEGEL